jgi:hypothetical protein
MAILGIKPQRLFHALALSALCIVSFGCQGEKPSPEKAADTPSSAGTVTVAPDNSLTTDEYIKLGVPAPDRLWNSHDYGNAVQALKSLAQTPDKFPRHQSKNSGKMFAKLVAVDSSVLHKDKKVPVNVRVEEAAAVMGHARDLLFLYLTATKPDNAFDAELVSLSVFLLRSTTDAKEMMDEFSQTLDPKDPTYKTRMDALSRMGNNISLMVMGALQTLSEKQVYRTSELTRLAKELKEVLPRLVPQMSAASRKEVPVRLRQLIKGETDPQLKKALTELLDRLEKV